MNTTEIHQDSAAIQDVMNAWGFKSRVAEVLDKSPSYISQVISGSVISLPIASQIAKILDCEVHEAFPNIEQYQPGYDAQAARAAKRKAELEKFRQKLAS